MLLPRPRTWRLLRRRQGSPKWGVAAGEAAAPPLLAPEAPGPGGLGGGSPPGKEGQPHRIMLPSSAGGWLLTGCFVSGGAATGICSLLQIDSELRQQRSSCTVAARTLAAPRTRARIMPRKRAHTEGTKALRRVLDWVLVIIGRGLGGLGVLR